MQKSCMGKPKGVPSSTWGGYRFDSKNVDMDSVSVGHEMRTMKSYWCLYVLLMIIHPPPSIFKTNIHPHPYLKHTFVLFVHLLSLTSSFMASTSDVEDGGAPWSVQRSAGPCHPSQKHRQGMWDKKKECLVVRKVAKDSEVEVTKTPWQNGEGFRASGHVLKWYICHHSENCCNDQQGLFMFGLRRDLL